MTLAQRITIIIDTTYNYAQPLIGNICTPQLFRYAICGASNLVFDWILYFLFYNFVVGHQNVYFHLLDHTLCITPHILTLCIVFPITLLSGFWLNKYVTFTQSNLRGHKQLLRYLLIVALNLLINYFGLKMLVEHFLWFPTVAKITITLLTVIISYLGQKHFSFKIKK